jgi:NodT family efflux transporter outer membrane factor (OMF) lipoprotein
MQAPFNWCSTRLCLLAGAAATLSACASVPHLGPEPQPTPVTTNAADQTFSAPAAEWPTDRWWVAYGDVQLDNLIDEALAGAPGIAKARARLQQAEAFRQTAASTLGPHLAGVTSIGVVKQSYNNGGPKAVVPHGWNDAGLVGLSLDWSLDVFGKNRALLAAATSEAEAARADEAQARLTLSTAVAGAYADLAQLYADRDAAEAARRVRADSEGLISARCAQGLETQAAVERAHAGRAAAEAQLAAVDEAVGLTRNGLAALLGQGPDRGLAIARPGPGSIRAFGLPANLQAELIGRRPDVVAARLTAEAAGKRIKAARAEFYPNVNLTGLIGVQSLGLNMLTKSGSTIGSVGPAITLPIFDSGRLQGNYRGVRARYDEAVAVYDATLTRALQDVADSAVSSRALGARLGKSQEAFAASQAAYELARRRYAAGLGTYLDVLTAEDALISNRRLVADLETRAFTLDVALVRALGGGFGA